MTKVDAELKTCWTCKRYTCAYCSPGKYACANQDSDHYRHRIEPSHPQCDEYRHWQYREGKEPKRPSMFWAVAGDEE